MHNAGYTDDNAGASFWRWLENIFLIPCLGRITALGIQDSAVSGFIASSWPYGKVDACYSHVEMLVMANPKDFLAINQTALCGRHKVTRVDIAEVSQAFRYLYRRSYLE